MAGADRKKRCPIFAGLVKREGSRSEGKVGVDKQSRLVSLDVVWHSESRADRNCVHRLAVPGEPPLQPLSDRRCARALGGWNSRRRVLFSFPSPVVVIAPGTSIRTSSMHCHFLMWERPTVMLLMLLMC